jgi:hypothetical protein
MQVSSQDEALGFTAINFPVSAINLADGTITPEWSDVLSYQNISEFGTVGTVKFSHNETHLYTLFTVDPTIEWIAVEYTSDPNNCMTDQNDGWTVYLDGRQETAVDSVYTGRTLPARDIDLGGTNDLYVEIVSQNEVTYVETVRPFNTTDIAGNDFMLAEESVVDMIFASSSHHFDPSGLYYLYITFSEVPVDPPVITRPKIVNYEEMKSTVLGIGLVAVILFINGHFILRMNLNPLSKTSRIIDSEFDRPTLKSRLNDIRNKKVTGGN